MMGYPNGQGSTSPVAIASKEKGKTNYPECQISRLVLEVLSLELLFLELLFRELLIWSIGAAF